VQNDYAGLNAGESGPLVENFSARRAAAYQAYYEHMPLRATALTRAVAGLARGAEFRLYSQQRFGRLANIVMLDNRQHRDAQACGRPGKAGAGLVNPAACQAWDDPSRTLLGAAQEQWFDTAMAQSTQGWTVIGQQTLFGRRDARPGPGELLWNDGWDGYGPARGRLTQSLQSHKVSNPVLLGGDLHENWVGHVKADYQRADSDVLGVEFCGTSITSRSGANSKTAELLAENPHFVFADATRKGYGVAEFTPKQLTTTLRVVDDVTRRDTAVQTLARFVVQAGQPKLERA
jgi:alkaline phosphatase D